MAYVYNANKTHCRFPAPTLWFGILSVFFLFGCVDTTDQSNLTTIAPLITTAPVHEAGNAEEGGGCTKTLAIDGSSRRAVHLDAASLNLPNRSSLTFGVRAGCPGNIHVFLQTFSEDTGYADVIDVDIKVTSENGTESHELSIRSCGFLDGPCFRASSPTGGTCDSNRSVTDMKLGRYRISWEDKLTVALQINGSLNPLQNDWRLDPSTVYNVFLAYVPGNSESGHDNVTSHWEIDVPCDVSKEKEDDTDFASMVTRSHLAGSVIAALLSGILIGVFCVYYGPKLYAYIRSELLPGFQKKGQKDEEAARDNNGELETLVGMDISSLETSTKPTSSPPPESSARRTAHELPGDVITATPTARKATPNTYTPYDPAQKGNRRNVLAADDARGSSVSGGGGGDKARKGSGAGPSGRAPQSPLPALPGDDVDTRPSGPNTKKKPEGSEKKAEAGGGAGDEKTGGAGAAKGRRGGGEGAGEAQAQAQAHGAEAPAEADDEFYVNANASVYEGLRHEAPIYENRTADVYQTLLPAPSPGKPPAAPQGRKTKRKSKT